MSNAEDLLKQKSIYLEKLKRGNNFVKKKKTIVPDKSNRELNLIRINMASNGTQNFTTANATKGEEGEIPRGLSPDFIQVCQFVIFTIWVFLQGVNKFLWWHVSITIFQMTRII